MPLSNETLEYMITDIKTQQTEDRAVNTKEHNKLYKLIWNFIDSADIKYATKKELNEIKGAINKTKAIKDSKSIEWIKTRWAIFVALIWILGVVLSKIIG